MDATYVRPYVKAQKNDDRDAEPTGLPGAQVAGERLMADALLKALNPTYSCIAPQGVIGLIAL